jgi:hypothetical protein
MKLVVKRLEIWVEAVAFTLCRGCSVGWNTEKKGDRFLIQVALYNNSLHAERA